MMDGFNHLVTSLFSSTRKMAGMVMILLIAIAVPVTLGLIKQNQDNRQEAAATRVSCPDGSTATGGVTPDTQCPLCRHDKTGQIFSVAECSQGGSPSTCNVASDCNKLSHTCNANEDVQWNCRMNSANTAKHCSHTCKPKSNTGDPNALGICGNPNNPRQYVTGKTSEGPITNCASKNISYIQCRETSTSSVKKIDYRCEVDTTTEPEESPNPAPGSTDPGNTTVTFPGNGPRDNRAGRPGSGGTSNTFAITGTVFVDTNKNGKKDSGETGFSGATVTIGSSSSGQTDTSGNYSIPFPAAGTPYQVLKLTVPPCYTATTPTSMYIFSLVNNNFGITPSTEASCVTATPTVTDAPTQTTTPTAGPVCGATCTTSASCTGGQGGCGTCVTGSDGKKTCQATTNTTQINLALAVQLPGIGSAVGDNTSPVRTTRSGTVEVYNTKNEKVKDPAINFNFEMASQSAIYKGTVELTDLAEGAYYVKVKFDNTVFQQLPGVYNLKKGTNTLTTVTLTPGDMNQDNALDMRDYSLFVACYGENDCATKEQADFNDDGKVDGIDYNILIRSFAIRSGD